MGGSLLAVMRVSPGFGGLRGEGFALSGPQFLPSESGIYLWSWCPSGAGARRKKTPPSDIPHKLPPRGFLSQGIPGEGVASQLLALTQKVGGGRGGCREGRLGLAGGLAGTAEEGAATGTGNGSHCELARVGSRLRTCCQAGTLSLSWGVGHGNGGPSLGLLPGGPFTLGAFGCTGPVPSWRKICQSV